ncbi:MAG TPA: serine acetyltransferase [Porphyromonadaceae bacterium]|nr:serine acetyltransferase [Porphyromonadaceae bacterium]
MISKEQTNSIVTTIGKLSEESSFREVYHSYLEGETIPSGKVLGEIVEICRSVLFPGFYGHPTINALTINYQIGVQVERLFDLLSKQIFSGLCFMDTSKEHSSEEHREKALSLTTLFIEQLPEIRKILITDVKASYLGDPAAVSFGEVIFCYPCIRAIGNYRIAHALYQLGVPLIPRMITEMGHRETGIDIHPAATIGEYFSIDHGTGVVIGATSIVGNHVSLYQGVTLGAKNFPLDENGQPIKGIPRHPIVQDNVVIYSNATILGRITIGEGSVIGGNVWVTEDVPPHAHITQRR